jgi:hypothetical protein
MNCGRRFYALALLCVLVGNPARAHIGDDLSKLREVYGATAQQAGNAMIFQRNGYSICVYFDGALSAMEVFTRDGSMKDKTDITPHDIDEILVLEGEGQAWNQVTSKSGKPTWLRSDNKLIARLSDGEKTEDKVFVVMLNAK